VTDFSDFTMKKIGVVLSNSMQVWCKNKRQTYTKWKWPENELQCERRHRATHCKHRGYC